MQNSRFSYNFICILTFSILFYLVYYLLLHENFLHLSIASIINISHHLPNQLRLLIVGILPIYIGLMIFGAATLGLFICSLMDPYRDSLRT
jgi:hypothetical protein